MGDSTSVPVETAQELLTSLCFTLSEYLKESGESQKLLVTGELDKLFELGIKAIESKIETGRRLFKAACLGAPGIENISLRDTLRGIGDFFRRYDCRFFAHRIPCGIDYQLCHPVSESVQGIEYINEYLRRLIIENSILNRFDGRLTIRLLKGYCPDYIGLLINLCEPVITNAVGLTLIGKDPLPLDIADADRSPLAALFEPLTETKARAVLAEAARRLCRRLEIGG